ncbi:MAG: mechanosensitive ion channel [Bdellovibrionaceae bacterium]|nr:mechanosensitive ion channel [Bdellovibrionales bacterium]MCB9084422.1 mechanosensitive ion channel [Pseudobdellovibrionaceae bacterium]
MKLLSIVLCLASAITFNIAAWGESSPLAPVKLDHPRDTMLSYMTAMEDYKQGLETNNDALKDRLNDAIRCLNLSDIPFVLRQERGREAAILLKEVIDRVIVIDYERIPESSEEKRWRLKDTEIVISQVQEGDRVGEFLFSTETVYRAPEFFKKVKTLTYKEGSGQGAGYKEPWDEKLIPSWGKKPFLGLPKWKWLGIFAAILISLIIKVLGEMVFRVGIRLLSQREDSFRYRALVALEKPMGLVLATAFGYIALQVLKFEGVALAFFVTALQILLSLCLIWAAYRFSDVITFTLTRVAEKTDTDLDDHLVPLITRSLRIFVVIVGTLVTIQNLGFNVMSLLAGLGLGGLAFALAAKDTAANLFGSLMILLDRPFKVGDWIVVGKDEGKVEDIGFRSTRIRTFYNSQISVPNSVLVNTNIDNMGRRDARRFKTTIGVTYSTTAEQLEAFLEGIKQILRANPSTRKDNFHVSFSEYGNSSLNILIYCHLLVTEYGEELLERQNILLEIMRLAQKLGIEFAFPTQTLHVETFPGQENPKSVNSDSQRLRNVPREFGPGGVESKPEGLGYFVPAFKET